MKSPRRVTHVTSTPVTLFDTKGNPIRLGEKLGAGGQATVFAVAGSSTLAAKLYTKPATADAIAKLRGLIALRSDQLGKFAALPVDLVMGGPGRPPAGFLMHRVSGYKEIHNLYGPGSAKTEFPQADWRFRVRTALNAARAVRQIHGAGLVIGDVNEKNILASREATVFLIDCDSFQLVVSGKPFLCTVGVPEYTPPELQNADLERVVRSPNHDAFGLAVVIFHLLFMGRHPYAGRYLGQGDLSIPQAIAQRRFAFGPSAAQRLMSPPPNALPLEALPAPIIGLFERAFLAATAVAPRPIPSDWIAALQAMEGQLIQCRANRTHHFFSGLANCPWCNLEAQAGIVFFVIQAPTDLRLPAFDLQAIWTSIEAVKAPGIEPMSAIRAGIGVVRASSTAQKEGGARRVRQWIGGVVAAVATVSAVVAVPDLALLIIVGGVVAGVVLVSSLSGNARNRYEESLRKARADLAPLEQAWEHVGSDTRFARRRQQLEEFRRQRGEFEQLRAQRLTEARAKASAHQLQAFLQRFRLRDATIPDIGPTRKAMLRSYGIETAADVTSASIMGIPGFGSALTDRLVAWRQGIERRFVFDNRVALDPAALASVEQEIYVRRLACEQALGRGAAELTALRDTILRERVTLRPKLQEAILRVLQAEVDLAALQ